MPKNDSKTAAAGSGTAETTTAAATDKRLFPSLPQRLQIPTVLNERALFPMLGTSVTALAVCSKWHYAFFQPQQLKLLRLLEHTARDKRAKAKALLDAEVRQVVRNYQPNSKTASTTMRSKGTVTTTPTTTTASAAVARTTTDEKSKTIIPATQRLPLEILLQESKIPVTDWAGECFTDRTAFQIAVELLAWDAYSMLLDYLPLENARKQVEKLIRIGAIKQLNYDLCLMTDEIAAEVASAVGNHYVRAKDNGLLYLKTNEINKTQGPLKEGVLYVREKDGQLLYSCVTLYGGIVVDVAIPKDQLTDEKADPKQQAPLLCFDKSKPEYKLLQSKILKVAAKEFHTAKKVGTWMTCGRRRLTKVPHHLKIYLDQINNRTIDENIEYFCLRVGGAHRKLPAHGIHEYFYPNRFFYPTPSFNEPGLPQNTKYYDGTSIYPLRVYKRILVVQELDAKMVIDPQTIVMQKKAGQLTAHWTQDSKRKSKSFDEKEVADLSALLPLNSELQDPDPCILERVLFKFGCDSGVGFEFALIRSRADRRSLALRVRWLGGARVVVAVDSVHDLAAMTALCEMRSEKNLDALMNRLYSDPVPMLSTTAAAVPKTPSLGTATTAPTS